MPHKINILAHEQRVDACSVYVLFPVGSIHESYDLRGCSHILEHMLFRNRKNEGIVKRLTAIGARYNGFTSYDVTGYFINTTSKHHKEAIQILYDMTMSVGFTEDDLIRERKVILEEYWQTNGNFDRRTFNMLLADDNIYNRNIIGRPEVIKTINFDKLKTYHKQHYKTPVIVIFCNVEIYNSVSKLVSRLFGKQEHFAFSDEKLLEQAVKIDPKLIVMHSGGPGQNMLKLSFATYPGHSDERKHIILDFLNHCFTRSSVYSLLGQKLRIHRGMVYSNYSNPDEMMYLGVFVFIIRSVEKNIDYVASLLFDVINKVKQHGLGTGKLLSFYKNSFINHIISKQNTEDFLTDIAITYVYRGTAKKHPIKNMINVVKSLTNDEISRVAKEAFNFEKMGLLTIGNYGNTNTISTKLQNVIDSYY
jgi:predicted Zn-dependent peptidase